MEGFVKRIYVEHFELTRKIDKLLHAINNDLVPTSARADLLDQLSFMQQYSSVLTKRIIKFKALYNIPDDYKIEFPTRSILELLDEGRVVARKGWTKRNQVIFKQVPADIPSEVIPKMTSLNSIIKSIIKQTCDKIQYRDQIIAIDLATGNATYWIPSTEDLFADDWYLVDDEK